MTLSMRAVALLASFGAALIGGAYLAHDPSTRIHRSAAEPRAVSLISTPTPSATQPDETPPNEPVADARTMLKYSYLLESIAASGIDPEELLALLQSREELARAGERSNELDSAVLSWLGPAHHAMYLALRDSDSEQRALGDFTGGLAQHAPLSAAQRRELLLAKLRHKQLYEQMLGQSGIDRVELSDQERAYAHSLLTDALSRYRDAYLDEMRAHLDAEQFQLLSDFERTEFELELQRRQQSINRR